MLFVLSFYLFNQSPERSKADAIGYTEFLQRVEQRQVEQVEIRGQSLRGRSAGQAEDYDFTTTLPDFVDQSLLEKLRANQVAIEIKSSDTPVWMTLVIGVVPWLLIIAFFIYSGRLMRKRIGDPGGLFGFTQSRARRFDSQAAGPGYASVAGLESAKQELQEIIDYLKTPEKFRELGAKMPKGILMMGPPGTGKTLLARATAVEAGVPFFSISGSEFIEMYVGVGASRVRDMFKQARAEAPALVFIDEIDSVGRVRGTGMGGGNDEREQTLNQVLAEMDGFSPEEAVVVLAATNRPDVLDPALLRPGRFDRKIVLELPLKQARHEILGVHTRRTPLAADVDLDAVAAVTVGFSGADIENLVNEAALHAARLHKKQLDRTDFDYARDRVVMGAERKDLINPSERERIACHEAGHALAAFYAEHSDPLQRVSIIPRGRALGMTEQLPAEDRHNVTEDYLRDRLTILLGGRAAEKVIMGSISSGATDDLQQATQLARHMVVNWGMSEKLGPLAYRSGEAHPFLGMELTETREFSDATAQMIDQEIRALLKHAESSLAEMMASHRTQLQALTDALLQHESLDHDQIVQLLGTANGDTKVHDIRQLKNQPSSRDNNSEH
ncbi:MAG: ATP-dependent zinc metalloprotease FtsH [Pseudomonadales bacterium]|nr:ATP-dependent zinc metalloprotease FtsH [Pseudomonadales bacterium]